MSLNLYNSETKELTQVAGNGVGVAKFGSPIRSWLVNSNNSATNAVVANYDGIAVGVLAQTGTSTSTIIEIDSNGTEYGVTACDLYVAGASYINSVTFPVKKGCKYYLSSATSNPSYGTIHGFTLYPFVENIVQPIEGGEVFSSQEVCIGTIDVDGVEKKVYRKSFTKSMSTNGTWQAEIGTTLASVVRFYGTFKQDSGKWSQCVPYYHTDSSGTYSIYCYVNENGNVQCTGYSTTDPQYFKGKYLLHVEYTKVND